ncbi:MAG: Uncharacterised protein [Opitutia bacterium UBA7350]|nr:MAG: Uncharacterised protein [Opitutae bacterium UBA7350]
MASPKNLTEQITHLRDRKGGFLSEAPEPESANHRGAPLPKGRSFATDYFMWFSYALLSAALITQLGLIFWLDLG